MTDLEDGDASLDGGSTGLDNFDKGINSSVHRVAGSSTNRDGRHPLRAASHAGSRGLQAGGVDSSPHSQYRKKDSRR